MQITFLNAAGTVLFVRDDMEQGNWTQEEYTVNMTFPYDSGKVIERGQRVSFRDPATNSLEFFEIQNVTNTEPEHYQQIIGEHIAVAELTDEHFQAVDITNKTAAQALTTVLTGTLWAVGNSSVSNTSSVKLSRGSVWQAVNSVQANWNCYIVPRITVNTAGSITGRYLDITAATGTWRGLRLSVDKNMSDASVVYDGSEILTAMYGYGGNIDVAQSGGAQDKREELTFKDVVWTATSAHPAKPSGQTYLEWPEKTALYGRNGRPRYGFYQNGDITDPEILLEKTWEALQQTCDPKINISGTVSDLYRLGYKDQPLRLHDLVIVEIRETGTVMQKQIIKLDVDLIDPTATRPEIGDYIPNIIYINDEIDQKASGGGGGGGRGQDPTEYEQAKTYADIEKNDQMIRMVVGTYNGDERVLGGQIALAINADGGTTALLQADVIDIQGVVTSLSAYDIKCGDLQCGSLKCAGIDNKGNGIDTGGITVGSGGVFCDGGSGYFSGDVDAGGDMTAASLTVTGALKGASLTTTGGITGASLTINGKAYSYQTKTIVTDVGVTMTSVTRGTSHYYIYASSSGSTTPSGSASGRLVTGYTAGSVSPTTETIYYLGRTSA